MERARSLRRSKQSGPTRDFCQTSVTNVCVVWWGSLEGGAAINLVQFCNLKCVYCCFYDHLNVSWAGFLCFFCFFMPWCKWAVSLCIHNLISGRLLRMRRAQSRDRLKFHDDEATRRLLCVMFVLFCYRHFGLALTVRPLSRPLGFVWQQLGQFIERWAPCGYCYWNWEMFW